MIKVGILSMQRIANYGSFLQAYGLKKIMEEIGCEVQFVDYCPGKTLVTEDASNGLKRKVLKVFETFKCNAPFKEKIRFVKYKKNYASNFYPLLGIGRDMNYSPKVDLLVIGSDEVFNCVQNNTNVGFTPELFGQNCNAKIVISYAASFGNTTIEKLKKYNVDNKVAEWLKNIKTISVRDDNSGSLVKALTGKEPLYNLDPVLVYEFVKKCSGISTTVPENNYMLLYGYSGRFSKEECKKVRTYANSKGLKILCIGGVQDACDKFIDCDPFQVIAYFQHADCVVTDTFHGTILSVITHRQFVSMIRRKGYGNSEKMIDLLRRLGLKDRMVDNLENAESMMEEEINYEKVDSIIKDERQKTYEYLKEEVEKLRLKL